MEYIQTYRGNFSWLDADNSFVPSYCNGKSEGEVEVCSAHYKVSIYGKAFVRLMDKSHIIDYKSGLKKLREKKELICDSDNRLTTKIHGVRGYKFIFKSTSEPDDLKGDEEK